MLLGKGMLARVTAPWLLYGANGYTGELIARRAAASGERPILAGRNREAVSRLATELGLEARVFALDDPAAVDQGLAGTQAVLHCAGPFSRTSAPMAEACLRAHVHYLDITGEIEVFEGMAARHSAAQHAGPRTCTAAFRPRPISRWDSRPRRGSRAAPPPPWSRTCTAVAPCAATAG
jgi:short subunit dehydrogenase-like uncharacterized protein